MAASSTVKSEWTRLVAITVESGKDLKNVDWIGQSDPYFKIAEFNGKVIGGNDGGDKAKSAVVENNLNPEWMETHIFLVDKQVDRFKVRVKDQGTVQALSKDIGAATIMLDTDHQEAKEYPLDTQGTVTLSFKVTPLGDVLP